MVLTQKIVLVPHTVPAGKVESLGMNAVAAHHLDCSRCVCVVFSGCWK
jgi:hypothetical protein